MSEAERQALSQQIEAGKSKMHATADKFGLDSIEALEVSQELDLLINQYMRVTT